MIKLLAMSLFILVGAMVGAVFYHLAGKGKITPGLCLALGVIGAFAGIWIADLADLHFIGNVIDNILFASAGSVLLLGLNLLMRGRDK